MFVQFDGVALGLGSFAWYTQGRVVGLGLLCTSIGTLAVQLGDVPESSDISFIKVAFNFDSSVFMLKFRSGTRLNF